VVGDVERAHGVVLLGEDRVEDLLHGRPPMAGVVAGTTLLGISI
jgi:hypothetical protein